MKIEVFSDVDAVAMRATAVIAEEARAAVDARGRFVMAVSGGRTPWIMLRALADCDVPWKDVHVFRVDERIAPIADADRNLKYLRGSLPEHAPLRPEQIYPMPVEDSNLAAAANRYVAKLREIAGSPPLLDLVHLRLGSDGHTASLVPGDPVLDVVDADVAKTNVYQGRRRMTLTYPTINRVRRILWVVTGSEKADLLVQLRDRDPAIPSGRVRQEDALALVDEAAALALVATPASAGR